MKVKRASLSILVYLRCNYFCKKDDRYQVAFFGYIVSNVPRRLAETSTHLNMK